MQLGLRQSSYDANSLGQPRRNFWWVEPFCLGKKKVAFLSRGGVSTQTFAFLNPPTEWRHSCRRWTHACHHSAPLTLRSRFFSPTLWKIFFFPHHLKQRIKSHVLREENGSSGSVPSPLFHTPDLWPTWKVGILHLTRGSQLQKVDSPD